MYYFAYGSNMSRSQMKSRCPDSKLIGSGVLKSYRLDFLEFSNRWQGGCADVIPDPNSEVWGLVYKISTADIDRLDKFEGNLIFYTRAALVIDLNESNKLTAEVYMLVNKKFFIPPTKEYLDILVEAANTFNFPAKYQKMLKKVKAAE